MNDVKNEFDNATIEDQWECIELFKDNVTLILDNDSTTVVFKEKDDELHLELKEHIGNTQGVKSMLKTLGYNCENI